MISYIMQCSSIKLSHNWLITSLAADGVIGMEVATELVGHTGGLECCPIIWLSKQQVYHSIANKLLSQTDIVQWLAHKTYTQYFDLQLDTFDYSCQLINVSFMRHNNILPITVSSNAITIGCIDPFNTGWQSKLATLDKKINKVLITPEKLNSALDKYAHSNANTVVATQSLRHINLDKLIQEYHDHNDNRYITLIVEHILYTALDRCASDIHLQPHAAGCTIKLRVDGHLAIFYDLPGHIIAAIIASIKVMAKLDITQQMLAQDGRFSWIDTKQLTAARVTTEFRVATLPSSFGEKIVIRILGLNRKLDTLEQLGFNSNQKQVWQHLINKTSGLILVTGPTGSGKSSSLYASLKSLDTTCNNICTIEDPIENVDSNFTQLQVHSSVGMTFANGLKAILRQDPDIIMVGEIRDLETAKIATQAALTGHLVLASLHTTDAASAILRLLDLGVDDYLLKDTLSGVLAQRLMRKLCKDCRSLTQVTAAMHSWVTKVDDKLLLPAQLYIATGCNKCLATGYSGRTGIFELLVIEPNIKQLITEQNTSAQINMQAKRNGMLNLARNGIEAAISGVTSMAEVIRVCSYS
jgi:general secretion pathway protein E